MHGKGIIDAFEHAIVDHTFSAAEALFGGLKDEFDSAAQGVAVGSQQAGYSEAHRHVTIVAAGMHHARVFGSVFGTGFLLNGQGVHIGAHKHGRAIGSAAQHAHHTGLPHAFGDFQAKGTQFAGHDGR